MFAQDRAEHDNVPPAGTPEYIALRKRDRLRRESAAELLARSGDRETISPEDLYFAAWLFNHGDSSGDALRGHQLAVEAAELGYAPARWLAAAAYDRWCMYEGRPQRYGTQYVPYGMGDRLWDVDPATTDAERAKWDVPPLAEQIAKAEAVVRKDPHSLVGAPKWYRAAFARWRAAEAAHPDSARKP